MAVNSLYPQTAFLDDTDRPNRVWQQYLQNTETTGLNNTANATVLSAKVTALTTTVSTLFNTTQPSVTLPTLPVGYTVITINGTKFKVPYYAI